MFAGWQLTLPVCHLVLQGAYSEFTVELFLWQQLLVVSGNNVDVTVNQQNSERQTDQ